MTQLRNRPFMVVTTSYHPAGDTNTSMKNFREHGELEATENMVIVDRISGNQLSRADYILDLFNQEVVKNRGGYSKGPEAKKLFEDYVFRYQREVKGALANWVASNPDNLQKVKDYVAQAEATKTEEATDGEGNPD